MLQEAIYIKNTVFLIFRHIQCLHLMDSEVAWVLVSSETQVLMTMGGVRGCSRRPQNEQICMPKNTDSYKTMPKAADLIFAGAADL